MKPPRFLADLLLLSPPRYFFRTDHALQIHKPTEKPWLRVAHHGLNHPKCARNRGRRELMDFKGDFTLSRCGEPSERTAARGRRQMGPRNNPFGASRVQRSSAPGASIPRAARGLIYFTERFHRAPRPSAVATADSSSCCRRSLRNHLKFIPRAFKVIADLDWPGHGRGTAYTEARFARAHI